MRFSKARVPLSKTCFKLLNLCLVFFSRMEHFKENKQFHNSVPIPNKGFLWKQIEKFSTPSRSNCIR